MRFPNREHAARLLADKLAGYRGQHPLVLGIPRGAVPMARVIAEALDGDLDVVLVHKLGALDNPELAIGSVDESGHVFLHEYAWDLGVDAARIRKEADELVILDTPRDFLAVGQFFEDFSQVTDEQAIAILRQSGTKTV